MRDRDSEGDDIHCCPYLGLASDPSTSCLFATLSHRCFRWPTPQPVDRRQQRALCLTSGHQDCDWFVSPAQGASRPRGGVRLPFLAGKPWLVAAVLAVVLGIAYLRPWSPPSPASTEGGVGTPGPAAATPTFVAAVASPSPATPTSTPSPASTPTPTSTRTAGAPPAPVRPAAIPTPTGVRPSATPAGPSAVPGVTPLPLVTPTGGRIHVVQRGETLFGISRSYGVSVEELSRANNLGDRDRVQTGQRLVIPEPRR